MSAVHGKQGGYVLARSPATITLKDLYESLAGSLAPQHCSAEADSCPLHDVCPVWDTWIEIKGAIEKVLERTTVEDLVERIGHKAAWSAPIYEI